MPVEEKQIRFGPFQLDTQCGQVRKDGIGLKLQGQPVQILEILLEKQGELVTREELRQRLWSTDTFVDFDHSLNTAIKRLRQALGDDAETPKYIETIPKRGYRFIAEVEHAPADQHGTPALPTVDENVERIAATLADAAISAEKKSNSLVLWRVVAIAALVLVALGAVVYWITAPPPMPRVVRSYALTRTGFRKTPQYQSRVLTDGVAVYFQEARPSRVVTMRVPVAGGETTELASFAGSLSDISPDGSVALFAVPSPTAWDVWVQPLPSGTPRLLVKDARWPAWSSDGLKILFARRGDQDLWQVSRDGTGARRLVQVPDISGIAVAPDGRHIRLDDRTMRTLWEIGSDGSNLKPVARNAFGRWSPDGNYFFYGISGELWVRSEERHWWSRSSPPRQLTFGPLSIDPPAISRDGKHLYAVGREPHGQLSVYDEHTGAFAPYLGGISACCVDFSRDGQWIAYVSYPENTLWRSRIDGSERRQLTVPPMKVINPRWSPDGKLIAFGEPAAVNHRIYVVSAEGGGAMLLPAKGHNLVDPTWSPDGKLIAYSVGGGFSGKFHEVWMFELSTQKSSKVPGSDDLWSARWSPDGKYLAALGGNPAKLWLFSFDTQKWSELISGIPGWPNWSRDSKSIYVTLEVDASIVRVNISDRKVQRVASLEGVPFTPVAGSFWLGLTPDGGPLATRDTGVEEIYAFDLEYK